MRKVLLFISLIAFNFVSIAQEDWTLIHPYPTINDLKDAHFVSEQEGWVVGTGGLILYTIDGGNNWETQHSNSNESFKGVYFIDDNEGWTVGWSDIYHTTNKGETWVKQQSPVYYTGLTDIFFIDHDKGWAIGSNRTILKTTDGGDNWTKIMNTPSSSTVFNSISFIDSNNGFVVGGEWYDEDGLIMATNDGGLTWTDTSPPDHDGFQKVLFLDSLTGWICGHNNELLKTEDGGDTWVDKNNSYYGWFSDIHFFDENNGILLNYGSVRLTFDAGETWDSLVYIPNSSSLNKFSCVGNNFGIVVGFYGCMCSTLDAGNTWENLGRGVTSAIGQIGFLNSYDGYAITGYWGSGDLIFTSDGGYNWRMDTLVENGPFYMMRINDESIYLLNDSSKMMKSENGGVDWELLDIPSDTSHYNDLQFVTENTAYMCSGEGLLMKTIDGGNTWVDKTLGGNFVINSLFFINEDLGWMLDHQARIVLRTINGGDDWTFTTLGDVYDYQPTSIYFINENEGFVTTNEGVIFKSINGGETWEEFYVFSGGSGSEIYFINVLEGWYRAGSHIYHTYDGGVTWINGQSFSYSTIRSMFFLDNQGWLGGNHGLVATYSFTVNTDESLVNTASISVFPNPVYDNVEIKLHDVTDKITDIKVFNLQGQKVREFPNLSNLNSFKFDVSDLIAGAYIIHVTSANGENLIKFIVQ